MMNIGKLESHPQSCSRKEGLYIGLEELICAMSAPNSKGGTHCFQDLGIDRSLTKDGRKEHEPRL